MEQEIKELLERYEQLREDCKATEDRLKDLKSSFASTTKELADAMAEADEPVVSLGMHTYSLVPKTAYSFLSAEKLDAMHLDKFQVLRENDLGDLITMRVDPRSLSKCLNDMVAVGEPIPEPVAAIVSKYDYNDISRTKISAKKAAGLAKAKKNIG